jgi:hypothetical protein
MEAEKEITSVLLGEKKLGNKELLELSMPHTQVSFSSCNMK